MWTWQTGTTSSSSSNYFNQQVIILCTSRQLNPGPDFLCGLVWKDIAAYFVSLPLLLITLSDSSKSS